MLSKILAALSLAVAAALAVPAAAVAEDYPPTIPPTVGVQPTLAGSTVVPECSADVPWITYRIVLTEPGIKATSRSASLVISSGSNSTTIPLGEIPASGVLEGEVLWPGAEVGPDGRGAGWPGWALVDGEWVETDGNFRWTRGDITATIVVNPELPVALSYPQATPDCATGPAGHTSTPVGGSPLAGTGVDPALWAFGAGAIVLLLVGGGIVAIGRRRSRPGGTAKS
ncbi:cell wall protein [Agromyces sp. MMS24-K17]|uniref:cell wall protein n=1 Tax=Agromyces sp. MMS24-K17 TaxID=3372850 RepID=UPI003753F425